MNITSMIPSREEGASPIPSMSSREIAELTGKRHDNVRADIERIGKDLSLSFQEKSETPHGGRPAKVYLLNQRETLILVSGYSVAMRAKIIDRWQELEAKTTPASLNLADPASLRTLLLGYTEKVLELQTTVAAQAPKVAFADAVGNATNTQTISQVAKVVGIGPRKLFEFLRANGILMVNNLPFQYHIDNGRFKVIEVPYKNGEGEDRMKLQARVTGKGVTFIQQRLAKAQEVAHG